MRNAYDLLARMEKDPAVKWVGKNKIRFETSKFEAIINF